jgi:DNA-binding transcriptional LysR family regulator
VKPNGLDFNRVAMFVAIVDAGGVSAAAAKTRLPKSSVSRGLTQLEAELGVDLIVRGGRGFQLTDAGQAFHETAARAVASVNDARDDVQLDRTRARGVLRIAAPPSFGAWVVAPLVARFARAHPEVEVELSATGLAVDLGRDGFDVVVGTGKREDSSAKVRSLGSVDGGVFASASYLRGRSAPSRPAELTLHECILQRSDGRRGRWVLTGPAGAVEVDVKGRVRVDDVFTALNCAIEGGGLVVLPLHLVAREPAAAALTRALPDYAVRGEPAYVLYSGATHVPLRTRLFVDMLVEATTRTCNEVPAKPRIAVAR